MSDPAYKVEVDDSNVCPHCCRGAYWDIIRPHGVALGTSYSNKEDAEAIAEELSLAYEMGLKKQCADGPMNLPQPSEVP